VPETLRVREHIDLFSSYYSKPLPLKEVLAAAGLEKFVDRKFGDLSGGQRQRVLFALAICGDPDLLLLDEPTVGLDVEARRALWDEIRNLVERGKTVLLTTHYLEEADALTDRIAVINQGAIIAEGTPAEIKKQTSGKWIRCVTNLGVHDEHSRGSTKQPAHGTFDEPHGDHLLEGSKIRVSQESSSPRIHGIGDQLPPHVLRAVRAGAELEGSDRRYRRSYLSDCNLRNVRGDGSACVSTENGTIAAAKMKNVQAPAQPHEPAAAQGERRDRAPRQSSGARTDCPRGSREQKDGCKHVERTFPSTSSGQALSAAFDFDFGIEI